MFVVSCIPQCHIMIYTISYSYEKLDNEKKTRIYIWIKFNKLIIVYKTDEAHNIIVDLYQQSVALCCIVWPCAKAVPRLWPKSTDCGILYMPSSSRHGIHTFNFASTQYLFVGSAGSRTTNPPVRTFKWWRSYRMSYPELCAFIHQIYINIPLLKCNITRTIMVNCEREARVSLGFNYSFHLMIKSQFNWLNCIIILYIYSCCTERTLHDRIQL